ncbi:uncharacterized protein A4U43_C02F22630 [Asparagus officinalis]|uniref:Uncharacterized protein n=1 Tax=Asparagus officinalis TaxID=4686 RepID=A0A5P1FN03_ASPOF|nr:uncharacterized protein A4U43_C02F22630 [Asparagus officinalis]
MGIGRKLLHSFFKKEQQGGGDEFGADEKHSSMAQVSNEGRGQRFVAVRSIDRKAAEFINKEHNLWTDQHLNHASTKAFETITSPFRKACTIFNSPSRDHKKPQAGHNHQYGMNLHGEVMACPYEDVQVMWSILDKARNGDVSSRS